jgi:hypothetical protein
MHAGKRLMLTEKFVKAENRTSAGASNFKSETEQENASKCVFLITG